MKILVTGASGLLGFTVAYEASKKHTVYGITHTRTLNTDAFSCIQCDLLAPGAIEHLLDAIAPDWVIHCAALANLDACETNPTLAEQLNSSLPAKLAQHVVRGGARLVHISTDAVFDGQRGNYTEREIPDPQSIYAKTKWRGELNVAEIDPQAIIARINMFGWSLSGTRSLAEFFFYNLKAGNHVPGFVDVFFCPLLANDLAEILLAMLEKQLSGLYHVVASQAISKYDFGVALARKFDLNERLIKPSYIVETALAAPRSPKLTLLTDKLAHDLDLDLPGVSSGLENFYQLHLQGYPTAIKNLVRA